MNNAGVDLVPSSGEERRVPGSPGELFFAFMKLGLQGFGGVLPIARHVLVDERRWLSMEEFTVIVARCQALPGPNIVNVSICIGARHFGARGALAACTGLLAAPFLAVLLLGVLYSGYGQAPAVAAALHGVSTVAAGLILGNALRMAATTRMRSWRIVFGVAAFGAVFGLRLPLALVLAVAVPLSVGAAWLGRRPAS